MLVSARKFIIGIVLFLSAGGLIGWLYSQALTGLLIAALLALAWQVRQVLSFDRERGNRREADYRQSLKELQESTSAMPDGAEQKLLLQTDVTDRIEPGKMHRDFVANAAHELRSPLTVVNGYLDALAEDDDIPDHWDRPIGQMRNQAMRMKQILDEMLELSRLESSDVAAMDTPVDIGELLHQVVSDFERPSGGAEIEVDVEANARLLGKQSEIESVVMNLLSNAVRHTPEGGKVSLIWRAGPAGGELIVRDTGDGIDASHIPRLTERFFRVDRDRSRDEGGIGLGLAIVKHVLVRHDAQLDISSEFGSGSKFRCIFPTKRIQIDVVAQL